MKNLRATENEILFKLTQAAKDHKIILTYTHKFFFIRLLALAETTGCRINEGLSVTLSVEALSKKLHIPLRTTIQSLNRLTACGVILRVAGEKTFPRSPSITIIPKQFYEKEEPDETNDGY